VRLAACAEDAQLQDLHLPGLETHAHSVAWKGYLPLNKPWGLLSWLSNGTGKHLVDNAVILLVDSDMVFNTGNVQDSVVDMAHQVRSGEVDALGNDEHYIVAGLKAQNWSLATHFNVSDPSRLQSIAVPIFMRKETMTGFLDKYYQITLDIVQDKKLQGLVHDGQQQAPWIAEMVGYTLATQWLHHETQKKWPMLESPQPPWGAKSETPLMIHYAHGFHVCGRMFKKLNYVNEDLLACSNHSANLVAAFTPPSQEEMNSDSCRFCIEEGDAFGTPATCNLEASGEHYGMYAWEAIHGALRSWRSEHCPLNT